MRFWFLTIWFVNASYGEPIMAQATSMEDYLASALFDDELHIYETQLSFLDDHNYNSPWLNRVEVRVGTEDANISLNEYRLRLSPTNPFEIKANKEFYRRHIQYLNSRRDVRLNEVLRNRYMELIELRTYLKLEQVLENSKITSEDLIRKFYQSEVEDQDLNDIVYLHKEQTDLMIDLKDIELDIKQALMDMRQYMSSVGPELVQEEFVSVEQILVFLQGHASNEPLNSQVREAQLEAALEEQELKIERAEARSNIGYVQGNFDTDRGDDLSDHIGFQVGIRLPITNPDKPELTRRKVDLLETEQESTVIEKQVERKLLMDKQRILHLIEQYNLIAERLNMSKSIKIDPMVSVDISAIHKLQQYQTELRIITVELEHKILEAFISYLSIHGTLTTKPVVNYLSAEFKPIVIE